MLRPLAWRPFTSKKKNSWGSDNNEEFQKGRDLLNTTKSEIAEISVDLLNSWYSNLFLLVCPRSVQAGLMCKLQPYFDLSWQHQ